MKLVKFEDTGWENLSSFNIQGRIKNGWAAILVQNLTVTGTQNTEVTIMNLPEKYRPSTTIWGQAHTNTLSATAVRWLTVDAAGRLKTVIQNANGRENLVGIVCYPV